MGSVADVFAAYKRHHPQSVLDAKRKRRIEMRLEDGFTAEDLIQAIEGCHVSPFHGGDNRDGRKYQSLELIMRDADHVEQFMELWNTHKPASASRERKVVPIDELKRRKA